jgi:hypothetical protein
LNGNRDSDTDQGFVAIRTCHAEAPKKNDLIDETEPGFVAGIRAVVLVTNEIPATWKRTIEHEGFRVLMPLAVTAVSDSGNGGSRTSLCK